jgi:hypothetical protein
MVYSSLECFLGTRVLKSCSIFFRRPYFTGSLLFNLGNFKIFWAWAELKVHESFFFFFWFYISYWIFIRDLW